MNLQELKEKFRHKTKADLADIDLALKAVPFLVRKIEAIELELNDCEKRLEHLSSQFRRQPPSTSKGKKDGFEWQVDWNEKKNLLTMQFKGVIDHRIAKFASNSFSPILTQIRKKCNVVNDFSLMNGIDNRVLFHFRKIFYTLDMMGAEKVIHILPANAPLLSAVFLNLTGSLTLSTVTATSMEEAINILDKGTHFLKV